jgi:hypothetical protein
MMANLEEVFKKAGVPTYTFVEPKEYTKILVALRTPGRALIVEGPSGIGKTSCIKRAIQDLKFTAPCTFLSARKSADISLIRKLPASVGSGIYVIDDFHRLDLKTKKNITDFVKTLADDEQENTKIVLIGINRAGQSLVDYAPDLLHRAESVKFGRTSIEKITELIELGQIALQCSIDVAEELALEADGSFAMAQVLCHEACVQAGLIETHPEQEPYQITVSLPAIREAVLEELGGRFFNVSREFCTGNKLRKEGRAPYLHLLKWLSQTADGALDTKEALAANQTMKGSVSQVIEKGHLSTLIKNNASVGALLFFDSESGLLITEDPKFHYYTRHLIWSKFAKQVGFNIIEFDSKFDFALSFAGKDRELADKLCKSLQDREISVFYDKNEQHRILANDVEEYLAPIYRCDAKYVVAIISNDYPTRIWTKFESQQFKDRFGDGSVIPIVFRDCVLGLFDTVSRVGYLSFDASAPLEPQVAEITDTLIRKLQEERSAPDQVSTDQLF